MKQRSEPSAAPRLGMAAYFELHPVRTAISIFLVYVAVAAAFGLAARALVPDVQTDFAALVALALVLAVVLAVFGWWRQAGFNSVRLWRGWRLMWIPFAIVLVPPFLRGIHTSDWGTFIYLVVGYALTGFMEEGLMRGIVMRVLRPLGVTRAIMISATLFGLMHVGNLLYRSPGIVVAQMVGAFVHGIGLGAIRLRTNTIWFVVALHGLHDLALKYTNFPPIPLDVVQVTLLMLFGLWLMRDKPALESAD